jgi:hypothetical protein
LPAVRLAQAKVDADSSELVKAVVAEYKTSEGRSSVQEALRKRFAGAKPGDAGQRSLDNLREVSAILAAKPPGDAKGRSIYPNDFAASCSSISRWTIAHHLLDLIPQLSQLHIGLVRRTTAEGKPDHQEC